MRLVFLGMKAAGAAVLTSRLVNNISVNKHGQSLFKSMIILGTAITYFYFRSTNSIEFCLLFGAIFSLYVETESKRKMNEHTRAVMKSMGKHNILFGPTSTYILFILYMLLWLIFKFHPESTYNYCGVFYFVACFIFGPASTIFAFLFAYFQ